MPDLKELYDAVVRGDAKTTQAITQQALAEGVDPLKLVNECMIPAMDEVGRRFECNEYFVPELLISARAMKGALELVRPILTARGDKPMGRVAIGTVRGDLHDIGKNLVASLLEGGGFEVIDLGVNVAPEKFIATVNEKQANIVAMSALLTTTMPAMKTTIDAPQTSRRAGQGQSPHRRRAHHADNTPMKSARTATAKTPSAPWPWPRRPWAPADPGPPLCPWPMHPLIQQLLAQGPVITDGAWGTQLQARGLGAGRVSRRLEPDPSRTAWPKSPAPTSRPAARSSSPTPSAPTAFAWANMPPPRASPKSTARRGNFARSRRRPRPRLCLDRSDRQTAA